MVDQVIVDPSADDRLDRAFMALADPVRRRMIARLSRGPATVNELADPFEISKQAVSKHIQVLEQAGLVTRTRDAQRRPVHLNAAQLEALTAWIDKYRLIHEQQFRRLDTLLESIVLPGDAPITPPARITGLTDQAAQHKEEQT
jgi:DNA-binding transcriptional ArsR family regulator